MNFKIRKNSMVILFPLIALMEPTLFGEIRFIDTIWNLFRVIAIIYVIISMFKEKMLSISAIQLLSVAFFLFPLVSTIINGEPLLHAITVTVPTLVLIYYFNAIIRKHKLYAVDLIAKLMATYVVINAVLLILFPNGFGAYIPEYTKTGADSRLNFLGADNRFLYFFIFTIAACAIAKGIRSKTTVFIILVSFGSMLFVWSGTGMIGILLLGVYLLFIQGKRLEKAVRFFPLLIIFAAIFVLIVVFNIQEVFADFIVSFLHKDVTFTGRIYLWEQALKYIAQKPVWGYGVTESAMLERHGNYYSPHNIILQLMLTGGCIQLALFIFLFIAAGKKLKDSKFTGLMSISIFIYMICSLTEATMWSNQLYLLLSLAYNMDFLVVHDEVTILEPAAEQALPAAPAKRRRGLRFVWKPPIWLEEDDGRATGIREENVSFGVFDTLIRRSVARPADLFRIMEQNNPSVPEHFAEKRMEAERAAFAKRGARMGLADIYEELLPLYGNRTNDLMALEIQYEIAGCRPVPENIDLVNLCMEHDKNVFLIADTYLPSSVIRRMLDVCGVYHYDRLYVSCEEGACKADGSLFWKVLADQEIRPHELRHIGSDRQGDVVEPWRVGVHVKRRKKKDQSAVDTELPEDIALYERTLQSCIRNCADDLDSDNARLGCETFGPLLAGFTAWLREQLRRDGIQDVYFLAGDGAVLKQTFDALEDGSFRTHSLYFPAQTAEQDHEALLAYLRACGMQGRVALVDTGRQIIVQKTLESLIAEAGLEIQVKGYYVGVADADGMQAAGYLYEPGQGKETQEKLSPVMAIFDTVFHAQHGAVRRIAMRDGQPVPELDAYEYTSDEGRICDEIAILRAYQAGALTLVREMNTAFPGGVPQIPGEAVLLPLLCMGTKPTRHEAELWGDFRVFDKGKVTLMARPRGVGSYLLHPGQFKRDYAASPWKTGFLRRLSRLPLPYDKIVKNR